jgi:hypothetical protein
MLYCHRSVFKRGLFFQVRLKSPWVFVILGAVVYDHLLRGPIELPATCDEQRNPHLMRLSHLRC